MRFGLTVHFRLGLRVALALHLAIALGGLLVLGVRTAIAQEHTRVAGDIAFGLLIGSDVAGGPSPHATLALRAPGAGRWSVAAEAQLRVDYVQTGSPALVGAAGIHRRLSEGLHAAALYGRLLDIGYYAVGARSLRRAPDARNDDPRVGFEVRTGVLESGSWFGWFSVLVAGPFGW